MTGATKLPAGALANGAEGIKESITNFTDARKSDIDNEHLPPDLIDPADMELSSSGDDASFEEANGGGGTSTAPSSPTRGSASPGSPGGEEGGTRFKKGHGRQSSLGTTMTSPSTRRRSLENTFTMIREAMNKDDSSIGSFSL